MGVKLIGYRFVKFKIFLFYIVLKIQLKFSFELLQITAIVGKELSVPAPNLVSKMLK